MKSQLAKKSARYTDELGHHYGRLSVINMSGFDSTSAAKWQCICSCGQTVSVRGASLRRGQTFNSIEEAQHARGVALKSFYGE